VKKIEYEEFHKLYLELMNMIEPNYLAVNDLAFDIKDKNELMFHTLVTDFFLQKKQREVLAKEGILI
jgi:hypothetical protein